jgi:selenoprotein W-related protein
VSLGERVLNEHKNKIDMLTFIPSTGGVFEISVNGKEVFSKMLEGKFPGIGEAESLIRNEIDKF